MKVYRLKLYESGKLATDYGISLCEWKLGDKGYPELDYDN